MERIKRPERLALLSAKLSGTPGKLHSLSIWAEEMGCAKSSLSEDVAILKTIYSEHGLGVIETLSGAQGGIVFYPELTKRDISNLVRELCQLVDQAERILPGGYIYLTDLVGDPQIMNRVGLFFAQEFRERKPDAVLTVETKGIPIAMMTALILNLPLVIVRSDSRISEGTSIGISYLSGTQRRLVTMSLPKRALQKGSKVVFIDDFLRRGGTASGVLDLIEEFESSCVGMGFLIDIAGEDKLVHSYTSLLTIESIDSEGKQLSVHRGRTLSE